MFHAGVTKWNTWNTFGTEISRISKIRRSLSKNACHAIGEETQHAFCFEKYTNNAGKLIE
jgi:hypothetical protein